MQDYAQLLALSTVLRVGSFEGAAAELGVTPSAVSQRIKALEERIGTVLVVRGTPCTPTPTGARLARHAQEVQLLEASLAEDLGAPAADAPQVRIAVNADSLATWVVPALAAVPGLLYDIVVDDQDHSEELLRRGEVSAAVTGHEGPVQGCDSFPLGALRYVATASPAFVEEWLGKDRSAESIARAPGLTFNAKDKLQVQWLQSLAGKRIGYRSHLLPSSQAFVDAALAGLGWGMNPEPLMRGHLDAGRLVALFPDRPLDVALYWQVSRMTARSLLPLTKAVRAAAAEVLGPAPKRKAAARGGCSRRS
jgi:LysR family transcriptional regulator (chromosome initiation inhibitor)